MNNITVKMGDKTLELVPTLKAARTVNSFRGGFSAALRALQDGDMQTLAVVIAAGTGKTAEDDVVALEEAIFASGVNEMLAPAVRFVVRLMHGGRDPAEDRDSPKAKAKESV